MTEPVAYMWKTERGTIIGFTPNDNSHSGGRLGIPLYTAEQLHPRVKMTKAEFDEWKEVFDDYEFFSDAFSQGVTVERYTKLFKKLYSTKHDDLSSLEIEVKFATLWANYNPEKPEETIEIVPGMKWFVQRNDTKDRYRFLSKDIVTSDNEFNYSSLKYSAKQFDTKEEAEKWTNPLTEAVQLAVEEE